MTGTEELQPNTESAGPESGALGTLLTALVHGRDAPSEALQAAASCARDLVAACRAGSGDPGPVAQRLRGFLDAQLRGLLEAVEAGPSCRNVESVLDSAVVGGLLEPLAQAIDAIVAQSARPKDIALGGRADFIALEEVLQLLGGGSHRGCLELEQGENHLDVYLDNGTVAFLDPHRLSRRVLPARDAMSFREIAPETMERAEERHRLEGVPIVQTLHEEGVFRDDELRDVMRQLGLEVLFEFVRDQESCTYAYRRLDELPEFAVRYGQKLAITPILLEASRRLDDWRSMTRIFPDPDQELQPVDDMFARISSLDLSVVEIKMLAQINNTMTPRRLAPSMGLPLQEIYQHLIRFAKEGVLRPPGGSESLDQVAISIEESVQLAFQALDANDDHMAVTTALDKVLGGFDEGGGGGGSTLPKPRITGLGARPDSDGEG